MAPTQDFILLRDRSQGPRYTGLSTPSLPYPGLESFGLAPAAELPPEPTITLERLDAADLREAARDPDVLGVARSMPTRLIEPMGAAAATTSAGECRRRAGTPPGHGHPGRPGAESGRARPGRRTGAGSLMDPFMEPPDPPGSLQASSERRDAG